MLSTGACRREEKEPFIYRLGSKVQMEMFTFQLPSGTHNAGEQNLPSLLPASLSPLGSRRPVPWRHRCPDQGESRHGEANGFNDAANEGDGLTWVAQEGKAAAAPGDLDEPDGPC